VSSDQPSCRPVSRPGWVLETAFAVYKRVVSPAIHALGVSNCIFLPTCSEYAYVAIARHGWIRGTGLALKRFSRCHPFSKGGVDPVP
jgi:putative membrane protein insertion efficiency factor